MSKITLDPILSGYDLSKVNANFQTIESELNEKVLYRDNPIGETNSLVTDIDADGKRIYNLPTPVEDGEPVTKGYLLGGFSNDLDSFAVRAENAAAASEQSATNSAASASAANGSAVNAANILDDIEQIILGAYAVDPITDNDAGPLTDGMLYFNNVSLRLRVYSGGIWRDGVEIDVVAFANDVFAGDGVTATFTLSATPSSVSSVFVFIGGVYQRPTTDFTVSGDQITFTTAPYNGAAVICNTANSIATNFLANNSVTTLQLQDGSVTTPKLADDAVTIDKMATNSVGVNQLQEAAVTNIKLGDNAVTELKIADLSVSQSKLQDNSVITVKLAASSVTTAKIADDGVTADKVATNAIATDNLQNLSVTTAKLADGAATTAKLGNSAVTTAKLADASVTAAKLAEDAIDLISGGARGMQFYTTAGSYTFTVPVGVTKVKATVIGGGSGGSNVYGGGYGGIATGWTSVSGSVAVVVGAGSAASASGVGNDAAASSFNGLIGNGSISAKVPPGTLAIDGTASGGTYNVQRSVNSSLWHHLNSSDGWGFPGVGGDPIGTSGSAGAVLLEW